MPYAVVGSNTVLEVKGKKVRGRAYPWGNVEGRFEIVFTSFSLISELCRFLILYFSNWRFLADCKKHVLF